jgi:2-iminobutanoate/2-iminopropanoate deaminase
MKEAIQIKGAPAPIGPYSQAIKKGNMLFVSGQIPLNPFTGQLENDNISSATKRVMENIGALLQVSGMDYDDIVKCSILLKDLENFSVVNEIYASYFTSIPPARETVEVSKLPLDVMIEISCIAIK